MMKSGRIHSIESLGCLDGPGVRTVFFMQGCNMKCLYCHNRDSWDFTGGKLITREEIIQTVYSHRDYYGSAGGVTFSGGEPLLQSDFLIEIVSELKSSGIHTALDTSGSVYSEQSRQLLDLVDLVILDIKHADGVLFESLCGRKNTASIQNLRHLQQGHTAYWIRQVVIEKFTTSVEQIDKLKSLIYRGFKPEIVELLPYHKWGVGKWEHLNDVYPLRECVPPSEKIMNQLKSRLYKSSTESRKYVH